MSININIRITEDHKKTILTFGTEDESQNSVELSQGELSDLIQVLGTIHWAMAEGQALPDITGAQLKAVYQTKWAIQKDMNTKGTLLAFQHPGYGPVGFVLSDDQLKEYARGIQKSLKGKNH